VGRRAAPLPSRWPQTRAGAWEGAFRLAKRKRIARTHLLFERGSGAEMGTILIASKNGSRMISSAAGRALGAFDSNACGSRSKTDPHGESPRMVRSFGG
jgi:hypothetical protein